MKRVIYFGEERAGTGTILGVVMGKHCKMEFGRDERGEEVLLKEGRFQVMMEWERPYMEACVDALKPSGDVLEVGFGCGYSATHIQKWKPKSHTIIEYHPVVAKRAREWAKNYPNVTIVEDTWQNALEKLGMFDVVFFDDYPLESGAQTEKLRKDQTQANLILKAGEKKMREIEEKLPFLQEMRYTDEDIGVFFSLLEKKSEVTPATFLRFFFDLQEKGNITKKQLEKVLTRLKKENLASKEEISAYLEQKKEASCTSMTSPRMAGDRLFVFLDQCLKKHMRLGARFSCFLEDPTSKYEDPKFFDLIITNPALDYHEEWIPITVPPTCHYYKGSNALVILITKRG